jgi:xanthine dehydrogenase accessory factor
VRLALLDELRAARAAGRPVVLATWLDGSQQRLYDTDGISHAGHMTEVLSQALRHGDATLIAHDGAQILLEPQLPPLRLILVGAVHIAEPLAAMATLAGFAVTIVDPRRAWATTARFPDQALVVAWPDVALAELRPDARTAVVTLTHDPKLDDPALIAGLRTPAFYLGCLGSQKTHASRRARLAEAGFDAAALDRLHGPVGLRLGARAPAEIAVAILAEIIATARGGGA